MQRSARSEPRSANSSHRLARGRLGRRGSAVISILAVLGPAARSAHDVDQRQRSENTGLGLGIPGRSQRKAACARAEGAQSLGRPRSGSAPRRRALVPRQSPPRSPTRTPRLLPRLASSRGAAAARQHGPSAFLASDGKEWRIGSPPDPQRHVLEPASAARSLCTAVRGATLNQDAGDVAAGGAALGGGRVQGTGSVRTHPTPWRAGVRTPEPAGAGSLLRASLDVLSVIAAGRSTKRVRCSRSGLPGKPSK